MFCPQKKGISREHLQILRKFNILFNNTHNTFIYGYMTCAYGPLGNRGMNECLIKGNVLFNNALNTFYFTVIWRRTYGKGLLNNRGMNV